MGYKRINIMDILEISRRYFSGETINSISKQSGLDRKTIRKYLTTLKARGITSYDKEKLESTRQELLSKQNGRPGRLQEKLMTYIEEIRELMTDKELDEAIEKCYRLQPFTTDTEHLEYLFKLYEEMVNKDTLFAKQKKKRK